MCRQHKCVFKLKVSDLLKISCVTNVFSNISQMKVQLEKVNLWLVVSLKKTTYVCINVFQHRCFSTNVFAKREGQPRDFYGWLYQLQGDQTEFVFVFEKGFDRMYLM